MIGKIIPHNIEYTLTEKDNGPYKVEINGEETTTITNILTENEDIKVINTYDVTVPTKVTNTIDISIFIVLLSTIGILIVAKRKLGQK